MKCVLLSVKPKYVSMILGKTKTIEIRKRFPKDFKGWVYIYCTQAKNHHDILIKHAMDGVYRVGNCFGSSNGKEHNEPLNGKVVARFWCDNVEDITCVSNGVGTCAYLFTNTYNDIRKASCLNTQDLINYLGAKPNGEIVGKAIHISQLEIFDKPKELSEFYGYTDKKIERYTGLPKVKVLTSLKKAPQSWQYIEVEE